MKRVLATIIALLLSAPIFAQSTGVPYYPQVVPPNTLVGRLGLVPGPTFAIPIANLAAIFGAKQSVMVNAKCDGATDDTAAINADLAQGGYWTLPPGATCNVSQLNITVSGTRLSGTSFGSSILQENSVANNVPLINISASLQYIYLDNFQITNAGVATAGSYGILANGDCQFCVIDGVYVQKQFNNIALQSAGVSYMRHVISQYALGDGIRFTNSAVSGGVQWDLDDVFSGQNVGRGFFVGPGPAGPSGITLGSWHDIRTFANTGAGVAVACSSTIPCNGLRLSKGFLGADNNSEIFLDTYGGLHFISDTFTELGGTQSTGPTFATPPGNAADGIQITANNVDVTIAGMYINGVASAGISTAATVSTNISGAHISNNAAFGIIAANCALVQITATDFVANTSGNLSCTTNNGSQIIAGSSPSSLNTYIQTNVANTLTEVAAPSTPASGFDAIWADSTNHILSAKNSSGTVSNTVVPSTCTTNQWVNTVSAGGVLGCQPIAANTVTNAMLAQGAAKTVKGNNTGSTANEADLTVPQVQAMLAQQMIIITGAVNFNVANTDTLFAVTLPTGFTRYQVGSVRISGPSQSLTTATAGVFLGAGGTGTAIVTGASAITVSTASDNTANNSQALTVNNAATQTYLVANFPTIYFRVGTAEGAAATGTVTMALIPVP